MITCHEDDDMIEIACDAPGCTVRHCETRPLSGGARAIVALLVRDGGWCARRDGERSVHLCPDCLRAERRRASEARFREFWRMKVAPKIAAEKARRAAAATLRIAP